MGDEYRRAIDDAIAKARETAATYDSRSSHPDQDDGSRAYNLVAAKTLRQFAQSLAALSPSPQPATAGDVERDPQRDPVAQLRARAERCANGIGSSIVNVGNDALVALLDCADVLRTLVATRAVCHRSDVEAGNLRRAEEALAALALVRP